MHGVSEVIAIILILMITISIAGLAYTFMSSTMASTTSAASSAVDTITSSMSTSFVIENMDVAKVYIRNTGQNVLSSLSVYVNDEPAIFNITPASITAGQIGTITIYSFIPDGAAIKVTSPNGFSTSKVANPCAKSVGCWKFDEESGSIAYDSSPYGNSGTLMNGPLWTSGRYGNALLFDGSNDYVQSTNTILNSTQFSIMAFDKGKYSPNQPFIFSRIVGLFSDASNGFGLMVSEQWTSRCYHISWNTSSTTDYCIGQWSDNSWHYSVVVYDGTNVTLYIDGLAVRTLNNVRMPLLNANLRIGYDFAFYPQYFNGTIDEVRIYNRAIY